MDTPIRNGSALIIVPIRFPAASRRETSLEYSARSKPKASTCTVESDASENVAPRFEHANIDRRPVDLDLTRKDLDAAFDDHTLGAEETGEKVGVDKAAHAIEDVHIGKRTDSNTETVSGTKRHTAADSDTDRHGADGSEVDRKV